MRLGQNGYTPSPGIVEAREAVADDFSARGFPVDPDRVLLTTGTSEGIEITLNALVDPDDEVLVPVPTYPLYTAVRRQDRREVGVLPHRSRQRLAARSRSHQEPDHRSHARAGR